MHIASDANAMVKAEKIYEAEIVEEPARIVVVAMNTPGEESAEPATEFATEPIVEPIVEAEVAEEPEIAKIIIEEPAHEDKAEKTVAAVADADFKTKQAVSFIVAAILMASLLVLGSTGFPFVA